MRQITLGTKTGSLQQPPGAGETPLPEQKTFNPEKFETLRGHEFTGYKGAEAVKKILAEKQGYVRAAFSRKEIGDIDLIWGDAKIGLRHILERRKASNPDMDVDDFVRDMADIVENGEIHFREDRNNYEIWKNKKLCVVTNAFYGNRLHLVLTEFPARKKPARFNE